MYFAGTKYHKFGQKRLLMKYFLSLFARRRYENLIREGCMYRLTYKGHRLIKEERLDVFGGFTRLNEECDNRTVGDRKRTDIGHASDTVEKVNFTKEPETL